MAAGPARLVGDSLTVFLAAIGSRIHMQGWRDGLLLEPKERRESGEDKREFEELLKRDWEEFDRRRKR